MPRNATTLGAVKAILGDMDYGVCRGADRRCFHDWPLAKTQDYRVRLYTRTGSSRHADGPGPRRG
jgi:hypothetical protein